jgi:hypothetical protein
MIVSSTALSLSFFSYLPLDQLVQIEIDNVSKEVVNQYEKNGYLSIFSLHSYEYKLSVLHFNIRRVHGNQDLIKSKDRLLFVVRHAECVMSVGSYHFFSLTSSIFFSARISILLDKAYL